jgi:hypothetical protein
MRDFPLHWYFANQGAFRLGQRLKQRESAGSDYSNKRQEGKQ